MLKFNHNNSFVEMMLLTRRKTLTFTKTKKNYTKGTLSIEALQIIKKANKIGQWILL
jgi:hypothetical protein